MNAANKTPDYGVVILGAGASSRMGRPKLLLPWRDTTVIGAILRQWRKLGAAQIAVVRRPNDKELVEALKLEALNWSTADTLQRFNASTHCIVNPQPERGMFSSIVCAANWPGWKREIASWVIGLGDQPHLNSDTLRQLLAFHFARAGAICQPEFEGHARHPVILPRAAFVELKHTPAETLKHFLKQSSCQVVKCPIEDSRLSLDMDTPEDYKRLKALI